uniref:MutS protein homolog 4 n=1 Tax=Cacopsylla melanoneura TaxID=428564 RepID=A0A8D9F295_9HEMI
MNVKEIKPYQVLANNKKRRLNSRTNEGFVYQTLRPGSKKPKKQLFSYNDANKNSPLVTRADYKQPNDNIEPSSTNRPSTSCMSKVQNGDFHNSLHQNGDFHNSLHQNGNIYPEKTNEDLHENQNGTYSRAQNGFSTRQSQNMFTTSSSSNSHLDRNLGATQGPQGRIPNDFMTPQSSNRAVHNEFETSSSTPSTRNPRNCLLSGSSLFPSCSNYAQVSPTTDYHSEVTACNQRLALSMSQRCNSTYGRNDTRVANNWRSREGNTDTELLDRSLEWNDREATPNGFNPEFPPLNIFPTDHQECSKRVEPKRTGQVQRDLAPLEQRYKEQDERDLDSEQKYEEESQYMNSSLAYNSMTGNGFNSASTHQGPRQNYNHKERNRDGYFHRESRHENFEFQTTPSTPSSDNYYTSSLGGQNDTSKSSHKHQYSQLSRSSNTNNQGVHDFQTPSTTTQNGSFRDVTESTSGFTSGLNQMSAYYTPSTGYSQQPHGYHDSQLMQHHRAAAPAEEPQNYSKTPAPHDVNNFSFYTKRKDDYRPVESKDQHSPNLQNDLYTDLYEQFGPELSENIFEDSPTTLATTSVKKDDRNSYDTNGNMDTEGRLYPKKNLDYEANSGIVANNLSYTETNNEIGMENGSAYDPNNNLNSESNSRIVPNNNLDYIETNNEIGMENESVYDENNNSVAYKDAYDPFDSSTTMVQSLETSRNLKKTTRNKFYTSSEHSDHSVHNQNQRIHKNTNHKRNETKTDSLERNSKHHQNKTCYETQNQPDLAGSRSDLLTPRISCGNQSQTDHSLRLLSPENPPHRDGAFTQSISSGNQPQTDHYIRLLSPEIPPHRDGIFTPSISNENQPRNEHYLRLLSPENCVHQDGLFTPSISGANNIENVLSPPPPPPRHDFDSPQADANNQELERASPTPNTSFKTSSSKFMYFKKPTFESPLIRRRSARSLSSDGMMGSSSTFEFDFGGLGPAPERQKKTVDPNTGITTPETGVGVDATPFSFLTPTPTKEFVNYMSSSTSSKQSCATPGNELNRNKALFKGKTSSKSRSTTSSSTEPHLLSSSTSDLRTPRNNTKPRQIRTPGTSSSTQTEQSNVIMAITEGRGQARGEVGIAAIDTKHPNLILCQISDSPTYIHTLTKIHVLNPVQIIMPNTITENVEYNKLFNLIKDKFTHIELTSVLRRYFSDSQGLDFIRKTCLPEYSNVILLVIHKFYALSSCCALVKYVEFVQNIVFLSRSLQVSYQGSENVTFIDFETCQKLELVLSQSNKLKSKCNLFGVLNNCVTQGGQRKLRSAVLQPSCNSRVIKQRLDCVTELIDNPRILCEIQTSLKKFADVERLLSLCYEPTSLNKDSKKHFEQQINLTLLLKSVLESLPTLVQTLGECCQPLFKSMRENFSDPRFKSILTLIDATIRSDANPTLFLSSQIQIHPISHRSYNSFRCCSAQRLCTVSSTEMFCYQRKHKQFVGRR